MKVLALVHKYPPVHNAGAEVMLHAMLLDLERRGHQCTVTYPKAKAEDLDGIPIRPTPPRDGSLVDAARASDVIITHLDVTPRAMRIARAASRPLVHLVHNDGQLPFHGVTADRADLVVWNSEWIAERYATWAGPTVIVRPPVPVADYELADRPPPGTPPPWGIDRRGARLAGDIVLVNLTLAKGAGTFYALAEQLPERHFLGVRGAYGTQVTPKSLRKMLPNVEVAPHVPSSRMRAEVYARARIVLLPSTYESWGRVAIEASAAGIPVIANPTPGLLESLGPDGLFADQGKPGQWAKLIKRLDDKDFYLERAEAGRARARELELVTNADLDAFALRLEQVVETYARRDPLERTPAMILSSASHAGRQCPVCGASNCACGDSGLILKPASRRGLPVRTYRTASGHFRLNEDDARRRGYLPDGSELPLSARKLLKAADVDVDEHALAYARANDTARERYLEAVHAHRRPALAERADGFLEELSSATPPPEDPGLEELTNPDEPQALQPGARVGEVLAWAGDDKDRLAEALATERSRATPRPTLVAELERLLEAE